MSTDLEEAANNPELEISWMDLGKLCCKAAEEGGEWAGAPMPIETADLVIAPGYQFEKLNGMRWSDLNGEPREEKSPLQEIADALNPKIRNVWWCPQRGGYVHVVECMGKITAWIDFDYSQRSAKTLNRAFIAFDAAQVIDGNAELMAMDKLRSMVKPHLFNGYLIHGMILETSPRSGVTYIVRKGRPTIAMRPGTDGNMKILCCLCLHPLGFYEGSFYGVMCPSDEVVAHLIMIRAKEEFFWRKANQHPAWAWEAGLN